MTIHHNELLFEIERVCSSWEYDCSLFQAGAELERGCLFIALCDLPSIHRRSSRRRAPAFPRLPRLRRRRRRLSHRPLPPPTLISSDPRSPARCLAHRMSPRRPRPAASPPPTAAARNPPPPPGFPTTPPPLLRSVVTTGPRQPGPRRPNLRPPPQPARGR